MERNLALEVVRVTEAAALACARYLGRGDEKGADRSAVEAMRSAFSGVPIDGTVVLGEEIEEDESPGLRAGEKVGVGSGPKVSVALDALDGTSLCANSGPNAVSVIAMTEEGHFLRCPVDYMDKIAVGPAGKGVIDLDKSPTENLQALAAAKGQPVEDLTVVILYRPRHDALIQEVRRAGARIKLISDGDIAAAIATARPETGIDILLGSGGAAQGILAAAALRCLGGDMQARPRPQSRAEAERAQASGVQEVDKKYAIDDLAGGDVVFAATGVTSGETLGGVRFFPGGATTHSMVLRSKTRTIRMIHATHNFAFKPRS